jgi:hypothetical protein
MWQPDETVPAALIHVYRRERDEVPTAGQIVGSYVPGQRVPLDFNPTRDRNVLFGAVTISAENVPSVSRLDDAPWVETPFERERVAVAGLDEHVPTVTLAPTISRAVTEEWIVFTPAPDAYGATVTDGEVRVRKASDDSMVATYPVPVSPSHRIEQPAFDCHVDYRWRNQSSEDLGSGRGWSDWSAVANAAGSSNATQPDPSSSVVATFEYDVNDSRNGHETGVIAG